MIVWSPIGRSESKTETTPAVPRRMDRFASAGSARLKDAASESARPSPFGEMAAGRIPNPESVRLRTTFVVAVTSRPPDRAATTIR